MKKSFKLLLIAIVSSLVLFSCGSKTEKQVVVVNNSSGVTMADGLNLQAVGEIVKTVKDAKGLENELNKTGGINNLDLNEDGEVDYINVQEYGEGNTRAFSLTVNLSAGDTQEIATIEVEKNGGEAEVRLNGNETVYGSSAHYQSRFTFSDYVLFSYLFSPHTRYYHRPYYPGYYPSYYSPYRSVPRATYSNRVSTTYKTSSTTYKTNKTPTKSKVSSPNANKTSSTVKKRSVSQSTASQKNLQSRDTKKDNKGGGFGTSSKKTTAGTTKPAVSKAKPAPKKTSSWGSSSSSKKSSSSWGSSSSSRRSGGFRKSDERYKTGISQIMNSLSIISQINGYTYQYKPSANESSVLQHGLIAQEVVNVVPSAVRTNEEGYYEVNYSTLVPVLVEAMQEQQDQINQLQLQVQALK